MKTSELIGPALDWAVAKCEGHALHKNEILNGQIMHGWWVSQISFDPNRWMVLKVFNPSTDWSQGGPIIAREKIDLVHSCESSVLAVHTETFVSIEGGTDLIAAMRCYVASKLGDEVDVPEELL